VVGTLPLVVPGLISRTPGESFSTGWFVIVWTRDRLLIFALYFAIAFVAIMAGYAAFSLYRTQSDIRELAASSLRRLPPNANSVSGQKTEALYAPELLERANYRLQQLQATLERTHRLLEQQRTQVREKTHECRVLQDELDRTIALVFELMTDQALNVEAAGDDEALEERERVKEKIDSEMEALKAELQLSEFLEQEQSAQLEELQDELIRADMEITALQLEAEAQIDALVEDKQALESAASQALVEAGAAATPALTEFLSDSRPDVRGWAAFVLGEIGSEAQDAVPELQNLLADPVERVRQQAQTALNRIQTAASNR
jgi:hypothetical protein